MLISARMGEIKMPNWLPVFYVSLGVVFAVTWDGWLDRKLGPGAWHLGNLIFLGGVVWVGWYLRRQRESAIR